MKIKLLGVLFIVIASVSCNKNKYNCTVVSDLGGFGLVTTERTFKGTNSEMLAFEKANTTETKTTTCH